MGNIAIPVSVISSKTLYQSGSLRLNDILAEQTGIQVIDNYGKGIQVFHQNTPLFSSMENL